MKRMMTALVLCALTISTAACDKQAEKAMVTEAEASAAADAAQAAWTSMDVAKIEAIYAEDIVGFDAMAPALSTEWATWHAFQEGFAAMKLDAITVPDRKIQILDGDTFVVSGTGTLTSKEGELKSVDMRFTDVYQKQADGKWLIVNEHVSLKPEAPKG
jgi:ketosteroid isomerase-like protein